MLSVSHEDRNLSILLLALLAKDALAEAGCWEGMLF